MTIRRVGDKNAFWDAATTGAAGVSTAVEVARGLEQFAVYVTVSGATTITVQVAHHGDVTSEGLEPEGNVGVWHDLYYLDTAISTVFAAAGSRVLMIPDFAPAWVRLKSSASVTATAGWEGTGG